MNKKEKKKTEKILAIYQAKLDGKTIQTKGITNQWIDTKSGPSMLSNLREWRVKPEPKVESISPPYEYWSCRYSVIREYQ